ncbi:MAG: M20/M25/M40 family metallo-hydrolase [Desulfatibacillaceae bacterium]|nr:M20/M25/M40 family metallo-hydrolase [Desulfatibacillaceae bacterium]
MINSKRLASTFVELVKIDSVSRHEAAIAKHLAERLKALGLTVAFDDAARKLASQANNLVARLPGDDKALPLVFCAHMDTVEPGKNVKPVFKDGIFRSDGTTILGADDKSAIAILLEVLTAIRENDIPHCPLEFVFTVCEEAGLLGAKNLDFDLVKAPFGYALDTTDVNSLVVKAPSANRLQFTVIGKEAHAGMAPEKGINAIILAGKALAEIKTGRIDSETTCNIGLISGGVATNIVPNRVVINGEARSHNEDKLERVTAGMVAAFEKAVSQARADSASNDGLPRLEICVEKDFTRIDIDTNHPVALLAQNAAANLGRNLAFKTGGGGSDANVFCGQGIVMGILGTGMEDVHSVNESVSLTNMVKAAQLVLEIIRLHTKQGQGHK